MAFVSCKFFFSFFATQKIIAALMRSTSGKFQVDVPDDFDKNV